MAITIYTGELDRNNQPIKQDSGITRYNLNPADDSLRQRWQESHIAPDPFQFATAESRPYRDVNEFDFPIYESTDAEEIRAQNQSIGESLMYGAGRLLSTTGTKALSGISGLGEFVVNSFRAANEGSMDPYSDTPASDFIGNIEDSIKESMPIYNERADQSKNFLQRAFTDLDYWTNDMVDGAAFMASAWLTGYGTTKLLGPLTRAAYANKLEQATKLAGQELAAVEQAAAKGSTEAIQILKANALQKAQLAAKMTNTDRLIATGVARSTESLMEGRQTYETIYKDLTEKGYTDQEAKSEAAKGAMLVSGLNMLLAPLDYDQYGGWFKTYSKSRNALFKVAESGALEATMPSFGKALLTHAGRNAFTEGILEEGLQQAMQTYAQKKYNGSYGPQDLGAIEGTLSEYLKGFTTKEGWDAMGAGIILGGLFGGVTEAVGQAGKGARAKTQQLQTLLANNDYLKSNMASYVIKDEKTGKYSLNQQKIIADIAQQAKDGAISSEMVKALGLDYEEAYKALDNVRFANWSFAHFEAGLGEHLMDKIDGLARLSEQELKDQGILTEDMTNSEGKLITPSEIAHRYREKARGLEELYNQTAARFDIPNRAVHRNIFEEAVLQKEAVTSLEKINSKIEAVKSQIVNINTNLQTESKPIEDLEKPAKDSPEAKQLEMLQNRKQDLINTLKDSYKRLDDFTNPSKLDKQKAKSINAEVIKNAFEAASKKSKQNEEAAKKIADNQIATFFKTHADNVFQNIQYGKLAEDDYIFATNKDGSINPNYVVGVKSGTQIATKEIIPLVTGDKVISKNSYVKSKTTEQRLAKLDTLIAEDNAAQLELLKQSEKLEQDLQKVLAEIEELKNYKEVADKRFKRGTKIVVGTKVFTLEKYQEVLDQAIALRDSYQQQLDKLTEVYNNLEENIQFLKEYQDYLLDPNLSEQEKYESFQAFQEGAAADMAKQSAQLEKLTKEYNDKINAVTEKMSSLDNLIKAIQDIITRKKLELAIVREKLSNADTFQRFLSSLPADIADNLFREDLETLRAYNKYGEASPLTRTALAQRANQMLARNPDLVLAIIEKAGLLETDLKGLTEEIELARQEVQELEQQAIAYAKIVEEANKQFQEFVDSDMFIKNQERLKKVFSEIGNIFGKAVRNIQDPKTKATQTATNDSNESSNLTEEEFRSGMADPAIRHILDVLNGTAGNNMQGTTDELTSDPAQRLWFTITEKLDPKKLPEFTLRAISKKNNPFKEEFPDSKFEFNGKPVIYLVLYYKDNPVRLAEQDNALVYTTMHETPTLEKAKERYLVGDMSDEELQSKFEEYDDIRQNILNSDSPVYFKVQGKSAGVKAPGEIGPVVGRLVKTDAEIKDVDINIVTSNTVSIAGRQFENMSNKKGFVLIGHKGQIINVQLPTMEELPGAVDYLMSQFKELLDNLGKDEKNWRAAATNIKTLINFGNYKGADFNTQAIFVDAKTGKLVFGGKEYAPKDVNLDELRVFLGQKLFQVDRLKLKDNKKFTDPLTKKVYPSYKHYLMSAEGRSVDQIPVKVNLALLQEQQFYNVYLKFDYNQFADDPTKEEELDLEEPADDDTTSVDDVVEEAASTVVTTASKSSNKSLADMSPEELDALFNQTPSELVGGMGEPSPSTKVTGNEVKATKEEKNELFTSGDTTLETDPWASGGIAPLDKPYEKEAAAAKNQLDAEEAWFKKAFPQFADAYERVKGIIAGKAIGRVTAAGEVLISDLAVAGTTYHEAWHVVSQFLLTTEERESIYQEYRERTGSKLQGLDIEEAIAEEFRSYMLTGSSNIPNKQSLFDKIISWIKALFNISQPSTIEEVFKNIKEGGYAKKNIVSRPSRNFNQISGMSVEMSEEANRVLTSSLLTTLFNGKFDYNTLNNLHKVDLAKVYDMAFEGIRANFARTYGSENPPSNSKVLFGKDFTKQEWDRFRNELADNVAILYNKSKRAEIIKSHAAYLAQFGLMIEPSENVTANDNLDSENPVGNNAPDWVESIKFSPKQGMQAPLRMLLLSLSDSEFKTVEDKTVVDYKRSSYFGVPKSANFENTMNYMQEKLASLTSGEQMLSKLNELAATNPVIPEMLRKLKASNGFFASTLTLSEVLLQGSFIQQFGKTKHEYKLSMINPDTGEIYQIDSNNEALREKMVSVWKALSKQGIDEGKSFYKLENGQYVFDSQKFETAKKSLTSKGKPVVYNINNVTHNLFLLKKMGIPMTRTASQYSAEERTLINTALSKIVDFYVKDKEATMNDMFASDKIKSHINTLAALELPYTNEAIELSHLNPEGETVYSITLNNYLSLITNKINNDGIDSLEHLKDDIYSKNSVWKEILKADKKAIKLVILEGQKINGVGQTGEITSKLTPGDFVVTQVNSIMNNIYPLLRAGDKKLEYGFEIDMSDKVDDYINIFKRYLTDELNRIVNTKAGNRSDIQYFNKQGKELITFYYLQEKGIIDPTKVTKKNIAEIVNSDKVDEGIKNYIRQQIAANKQLLLDYNIISASTNNVYVNNGISTNLKGYAEIKSTISNAVFNKFLQDFTLRSLMSNIEQSKLFLGDLAFFNHAKNDGPKRVGGVTGTKSLSITDQALNSWLSQNPRKDNKAVDGKISVGVFADPVMNAEEFISNASKNLGIPANDSFFDAYRKVDVADAQGYITLPEYREFLIRAVAWDTKYERVYDKMMAGEPLTKADLKSFLILKPQHFGPQENEQGYTPLFLKFSLAPLIPSMIKGTKLEQINNMMMAKGIGVATFGSAAKVGAIVNEGLVGKDGKINENLEISTSTIDYKYFGLQLEPSDEVKTTVTFGTQFRKLILNNLLVEGKGKTIQIKDYSTGKLKEVNTETLVKDWNNIIDDLTRMEMNDLLDELKVTKTKDGYLVSNPTQFRDLLIKEALKRGVSTNVIIGLEMAVNATSFNLDAVANKVKVENILMSLINNNLIKQTTFGDMKVQMSSFATAPTEVETSSDLKFYETGKDGVRHIEVMLPHWFKELYGVDVDMSKIDSRVLNFLGYRIPTQDYASMDVLVVKGFLPQSAGNTIIVPAELPAKGGSDFDIDKMTLFLPNYEFVKDSTGDYRVVYVSPEGNTKQAKQNRIIELASQILTSPNNYKSLIRSNTAKTLQSLNADIKRAKGIDPKVQPSKGRMLEFSTNVKTSLAFWTGKDGVGIAAQQNTHHSLSQQIDLKISLGKTFIILGQEVPVKLNLNHNKSVDKSISYSMEYDVNKEHKISDLISEFLNAYVDIAKDPFILDLNAGTNTANVWFSLIRAGVPVEEIGYFINQPIIKDILDLTKTYQSQFLEAKNQDLWRSEIIEKIMAKYKINEAVITNAVNSNSRKTLSQLKKNLLTGTEDVKFNAQILVDYLVYSEVGNDLSNIARAITFDTAGVGKTRWQSRALLRNVDNALNNSVFQNAEKVLQDTLIKPFYEVAKMAGDFYNQGYSIDIKKAEILREQMFEATEGALNSIEQGKLLSYMENEFLLYLLSKEKINGKSLSASIKALFTGENSVAHKLNKFKTEASLKDNFLIQQLIPVINSNRASTDNVILFDSVFNSYQQDLLLQGFEELFNHPKKEVRDFGKILMSLMLLQGGPNMSPVTLYNLVPNSQFVDKFSKIIMSQFRDSNVDISSFIEEFYMNNWNKEDFVPSTHPKKLKNGSVTLKSTDKNFNKPFIRVVIKDTKGNRVVKLFKRGKENKSSVVFSEVPKRGNGFYLKEYYGDMRNSTITANLLDSKPETKQSIIKKAAPETASKALMTGEAAQQWAKYGVALTKKWGDLESIWGKKDSEWRAYKIKCL